MSGGWYTYPLWKMMDRKSVGMTWHPQLNGQIEFMFQTTNQLRLLGGADNTGLVI